MMCIRVGVGVLGILFVAGVPLQGQRQVATQAALPQAASSHEASTLLQRTVTLELHNASLQQALDLLSERTGVFLQYNAKILAPYTQTVTASIRGMSLRHALDLVLAGTFLRIIPDGPTQLSVVESGVLAQAARGTIRGRVVHATTKQPIENARVVISGQSKAVVTGRDGIFTVSVEAGQYTLAARAVGFSRATSTVTVKENEAVQVELVLSPSASVLDEVVVTGTVIATERKAVPTPVTVITAEDIEQRGITRIEQLFRGDVPGVFALEQGSAVYTYEIGKMVSSQVLSRGSASLDGSANPLKTFVDGIEMTDPSYLGTIDPTSIERIEIVTGPQAATVYGSGAMGGVMQIFTKKGSGNDRPAVTAAFRYGMLESNLSAARTPSHNHAVSVTGGVGTEFSYSTGVSYDYTGQWRPDLFSRRFGGSVGMTYGTRKVTVEGSFNRTQGKNGTSGASDMLSSPKFANLYEAGIISGGIGVGSKSVSPKALRASQVVATNSSQTVSLSVRHRITSWLSHQGTIGSSSSDFETLRNTPMFETPSDSSKWFQALQAERVSWSYNLSFVQPAGGLFSNTVLLGASGSSGKSLYSNALFMYEWGNLLSPYLTRGAPDKGGGGFAQWQLGFANQLFLTTALRAEANGAYGSKHAIDWTPRYGATYTVDIGEVSVKLLGSYGRATRAPTPEMREGFWTIPDEQYVPSTYESQRANPDLTPEYSRGPQGGIEVYYGTRGSLSINHYRQRITDLIERLAVDSVERTYLGSVSCCAVTRQYLNTAAIRQYGWELTASARIWYLSLNGTYSWNDSRVDAHDPRPNIFVNRVVGQQLSYTPTHTGSLRIQYASHGLSVGLVNSFIGKSRMQAGTDWWWLVDWRRRLSPEMARARFSTSWEGTKSGYIKSDLIVQQVLSPRLSLTLNVNNLGNSYGSEGSMFFPALGRKTLIGVSLRSGQR